jgi:putative endonuclease
VSSDLPHRFGERAERLACRELRRRGYEIVARRFRTRLGEIDIVAREGPVLVFVEVKARRGAGFGSPLEALTWWKRRRLLAMARQYLASCGGLADQPCRFDVVGIVLGRGGRPQVELVRDAFRIAD